MKSNAQYASQLEVETEASYGMALLAVATAAELAETATPGQARGFALALGRRIAASEALQGVTDAAALCQRVNAFWQALGWGEAEIALESEAIIVRHRYAPKLLKFDKTAQWPAMLLAILEGAYDSWFRQLGSGPSLTTTAAWNGETVELRHGR